MNTIISCSLVIKTSIFADPVSQRRKFPEGLKVGEYNLLVVPPG